MTGLNATRKAFLATAFGTILLTVHGCGGSKSKEATASTGTDGGSLYDVQISPSPGTAFIPSNTKFRLYWPQSAPPPTTFTAALKRYKEAHDDVASDTETQRTELSRQGTSYTWTLQRTDDFALESGGVYFIELNSGQEQIMATYIISSDRSVPPLADNAVRPAGAADTETMVHSVTVR